ncbi:RNA polymerase sigma factor [Nakamurella lactea]|jgi:RNA polymerase sigma factor (sigma-70 family)|uniref:RNA polymerase sigma factor n=1 Tax=Nakamurella lactea TaxID=459515 RepID=UPI00048B259D|nr:RNA polymerase sigma factor [Nakamurella lactea]
MDTKPPFETVVDQHGSTVLRVCRAVLGPGPDADDAWSEVFLAALRSYPELPAATNMQAWLVTVAHRKAIDIIRSRQRRATPIEAVPDTESTIGLPDRVDEQEIWQAVAALPDRQRMAVAYHYLGGLPYAGVAEELGGSTDAARRAAADGIKKLRTTVTRGGAASKGAPR